MFKNLSARDPACLVLRLGVGTIFIMHGYLKISHDWGTTWEKELGTPTQVAVAWTEMIGGIAVLIGLFSRLAALALAAIMCGALYIVVSMHGFLGRELQPGAPDPDYLQVGAEYNFALIMLCLAVVILGSGAFSVDHWIRSRRKAGVATGPQAAVGSPHMGGAPAHTAPR